MKKGSELAVFKSKTLLLASESSKTYVFTHPLPYDCNSFFLTLRQLSGG
jgi:hypothetical protein